MDNIEDEFTYDKFEDLKGKTLTGVEVVDNNVIIFTDSMGQKYKLYHSQNCCEVVTINDICGDLSDLLNSPILLAEVASNKNPPPGRRALEDGGYLWTFYKIASNKGGITIRWFGSSNSYYSVTVDFQKCA